MTNPFTAYSLTHQWHELSPLHDGRKLFAALAARADLLPQQVPGREVGVPVLGHDLVALRALPAAGPAQHPHNRQLGLAQRSLVNICTSNVRLTRGIIMSILARAMCTCNKRNDYVNIGKHNKRNNYVHIGTCNFRLTKEIVMSILARAASV